MNCTICVKPILEKSGYYCVLDDCYCPECFKNNRYGIRISNNSGTAGSKKETVPTQVPNIRIIGNKEKT